jgi:hypothetical protein
MTGGKIQSREAFSALRLFSVFGLQHNYVSRKIHKSSPGVCMRSLTFLHNDHKSRLSYDSEFSFPKKLLSNSPSKTNFCQSQHDVKTGSLRPSPRWCRHAPLFVFFVFRHSSCSVPACRGETRTLSDVWPWNCNHQLNIGVAKMSLVLRDSHRGSRDKQRIPVTRPTSP